MKQNMRLGLAALSLAASLYSLPAAAKTYYCEAKQDQSAGGRTVLSTVKAWVKSPTQFRIEQSGQGHGVVMIGNNTDVWMYDPARKQGVHGKQPAANIVKLNQMGRPVGNDLGAFIKTGGKKAGQQKIDGVLCDVYRKTDPNGLHFTLWVIPGPDKLTKRHETSGKVTPPTPPGGKSKTITVHAVTTFTNWQVNKPVPDSLLRPPVGIKFMEQPAAGAIPAPGAPGKR